MPKSNDCTRCESEFALSLISTTASSPQYAVSRSRSQHNFLHISDDLRTPFDQSKTIATTVGCVCLSWRNIAWSTPQLWNYISTSEFYELPYKIPSFAEQAVLSGTLPLHLSHLRCFDEVLPVQLLEELRPHAARWEFLEIGALHSVLDAIPVIDLPNLDEAHLALMSPSRSGSLYFLAGASALRRLSVKMVQDPTDDGFHPEMLQIPPFSSLVYLTLSLPMSD